MLTHVLVPSPDDPTHSLLEWAGPAPAIFRPHPRDDYADHAFDLKMSLPAVVGDGVRSPKMIDGNWARLYAPSGFPLTWIGDDGPGPSNFGMVDWRRLHLRSAGIETHNMNGGRIEAEIFHAGTALRILNRNAGGQSEHNTIKARIANCTEGIVIGAGSGNPSHRDLVIDALITGTDKPFTLGPRANAYGSDIRLRISAKDRSSAAQVCLDGAIHGASLNVLIENECNIGIALADRTTADISTQAQGYIRAHFVHRVEHPAIFDGPKANLPPYRFTWGNPANGNADRPAWVCTDGEVWESSKAAE